MFAKIDHRRGIVHDVARLKGRSHQLALPPVRLSLAGKQSIASNRLKGLMDKLALIKIFGMLNQDLLHMFRRVKQSYRKGTKMKLSYVTTFARDTQVEAKTIPGMFKDTTNKRGFCYMRNRLCRHLSCHTLNYFSITRSAGLPNKHP